MTDTIKLSFNGKPVGLVMVKYISYQFDSDNTNAEDKILEFLDSTSIIENVLSDNSNSAAPMIMQYLSPSTFLWTSK